MAVPALADTERLTTHTISSSTGPLSVGFHIYADDDDYAQWLECWDDGVQLTPGTDFTVSSLAGGADLSIIARPITDARVTFTSARSGTIHIVGARRPRQASQFRNGVSVTADQHNRRYTDLMAICREFWDLKSRMFLAQPGETGGLIDGINGDLIGPASSTDNAIARWNGTSGGALQNSGVIVDDNNAITGFTDITQTAPGGFWEDVGSFVSIARLDRVFVGAATDNDGKLTNVVKDWLETERTSTTTNSQFAVLSEIGQIAVLGGSRTSDFTTAGSEGCVGVTGWAVNNNSTQVQAAYAGYFEARRKASTGTTLGIELDTVNQGAEVSVNAYGSYDYSSGLTAGLWLASGGGVVGANDASVGIFFVNNEARWKKGIVFCATSLEGTDGTGTGSAVAVEMARGHLVRWLQADGDEAASIHSDVTNSGPLQRILFSDSGVLFRNSADKNMLRIDTASGYVNGVALFPKATGSNPILQAVGDDTNVGLILQAQATEFIRFANTAVPNLSGGAALGTTTLMWSGVFLASGASINWDNSDVTQTHSANKMAWAGATSGYSFVDGPVLIGHTSGISVGAVDPFLQIHTDGSTRQFALYRWSNDASAQIIIQAKSRGATPGSHTIVQSGDVIGNNQWFASDGTAFIQAARIRALVDGTPGTNDMPGKIDLSTTADGASSPTIRMSIFSDGGINIGSSTTSPGANVLSGVASIVAHDATAIPAGGTAGAGFKFSSTANFGVFFGSGAPTLSAAQGSLYVRSDGSSTSTRLYVNTNGTTGWTNVTTAA